MTHRTVVALLALVGCSDKGDDTGGGGNGGTDDSTAPVVDVDEDGFSVEDDCDDSNAAIHPDAAEVCDGVDNDCDTQIDVGATDAADYWVDADVDGYGAGAPTASCEPIKGSVTNGDDCDDTRVDVNPLGSEICDEADADEDCDTLVDDDDDSLDPKTAMVLYADGDEDTYGDAAASVLSCDPRAGYVADGTDCDDVDVAINPGADEICGDGIDNDCDTNGCGWSGTADTVDSDAKIVGAIDYSSFGNDVARAGDVNGDGAEDMIVGTYTYGTAYLIPGPIEDTMTSGDAVAELTSAMAKDINGAENFSLGDQDADGYDDLLVSAWNFGYGNGRVYVVLGPVTGSNTTEGHAAAIIDGDSPTGLYSPNFGMQPSAGDLNGDGVLDLFVGEPGGFGDTGGTYLFYGPVTSESFYAADADVGIAGLEFADFTGSANSADGDVNGDGIDDALIGARQADYSGTDDGAVYLFYGPVSGVTSVKEADTVFYGASDGQQLGWITALNGDVDGDGADDVGLGAPDPTYGTAGDVWLFYAAALSGSEVDVAKASAQLTGDAAGDQFGYALDFGGDLDADGRADVAVGAPYSGTNAGTAYVFEGPVSGAVAATAADFTILGSGIEMAGSSVVFFGDLSEDEYSDLAVGSQQAGAGGMYRGAVTLWYGGGL
jgi:hypothetical protein